MISASIFPSISPHILTVDIDTVLLHQIAQLRETLTSADSGHFDGGTWCCDVELARTAGNGLLKCTCGRKTAKASPQQLHESEGGMFASVWCMMVCISTELGRCEG